MRMGCINENAFGTVMGAITYNPKNYGVIFMTLEEIKNKLEKALTPRRFIHSLNVMNCSMELASRYKADNGKAALAGLLHDCARDIRGPEVFKLCEKYGIRMDEINRRQPELLHGPLGSYIAAQEYGIADESILKAISCHTTGCENMDLLAKIVFIADCIEPNRNFKGVSDIRKAADENIDDAMIIALERTMKYVMAKGTLIHPDTVNARNFIIIQKQG